MNDQPAAGTFVAKVFDVMQYRFLAVELKPEIPFYSKPLDTEPPLDAPSFVHFNADGRPVVQFRSLDVEKRMLQQFQGMVEGWE